MTRILCLVFFFSGASALIFEALWFRLSRLAFGNSVFATSIVLSSFMCGLALGNGLTALLGHKIKHPVRFYAILEGLIAVLGFSLVLIIPLLTEFLVPLYHDYFTNLLALNFLRAVITFLLMVIPATAMGATLPILVKALYSENLNYGKVLGILYGWNTLGAVAGVITCEMIFVSLFGVIGAGAVAASFNIVAAIVALLLYKKNQKGNILFNIEKTSIGSFFSKNALRYLLAGFLSGFALLALEVIWFRFMILFFMATSWNFAVMLAVVLLGISIGGLVASKWFQYKSNAHEYLMPILFINGILVVLIYGTFSIMFSIEISDERIILAIISLFLMFPVSFISGVIFTMFGNALHSEIEAETKTTGLLTLANTIGGMCGSLIAGAVFIPYLGLEKSFFLIAILYGGISIIVYTKNNFIKSTV